jgi:aminoglycoside phosphotransferase (APT) family kinase protein
MAREPQVLALLRQNGLPVPLVETEDMEGKLVGRPFFIMRSEGERTAAELSGLSSLNRRRLFREVGATLARIHAIAFNAPADFNGHRPVEPRFVRTPLEGWHQKQIEYARRHRLFEPAMLDELEYALGFLPEPRRFAMCHGDFNASQCVRIGPRVKAVVDWEGSYIGDPVFDFAVYDALLEVAAPADLAGESRQAYTAIRALPEDYETAFRPFKLAHAVALGASFHAKRRGGSIRSVRTAVARMRGELPTLEAEEVIAIIEEPPDLVAERSATAEGAPEEPEGSPEPPSMGGHA